MFERAIEQFWFGKRETPKQSPEIDAAVKNIAPELRGILGLSHDELLEAGDTQNALTKRAPAETEDPIVKFWNDAKRKAAGVGSPASSTLADLHLKKMFDLEQAAALERFGSGVRLTPAPLQKTTSLQSNLQKEFDLLCGAGAFEGDERNLAEKALRACDVDCFVTITHRAFLRMAQAA
jgi:hypothetical protein